VSSRAARGLPPGPLVLWISFSEHRARAWCAGRSCDTLKMSGETLQPARGTGPKELVPVPSVISTMRPSRWTVRASGQCAFPGDSRPNRLLAAMRFWRTWHSAPSDTRNKLAAAKRRDERRLVGSPADCAHWSASHPLCRSHNSRESDRITQLGGARLRHHPRRESCACRLPHEGAIKTSTMYLMADESTLASWGKVAETVSDIFKELAGPFAIELGLTFADHAREYHIKNAVKILSRVRQMVSSAGFTP
jgi:hypothetical protein